MLSLERIKGHLRIPHNLEDEVIQEYIEWADHDVAEAVFDSHDPKLDKKSLENDPSYKKAVTMLTSYYYENRLTMSEPNIKEAPFSVTHAIQTLRAHRDRYL
ncbi:head-tail connector protein [Virgibacillus sp. FSP13]